MSSMTVAEAGRKGGNARAANLSDKRKKQIARMGYLASPLSRKRKQSQCQNNGKRENKVK